MKSSSKVSCFCNFQIKQLSELLGSSLWAAFETKSNVEQFDIHFEKIEKFDYPHFLVGLIYRWGKGLKNQKWLKTVCFLHNMRKKRRKKILLFFWLFWLFRVKIWLFRGNRTFYQHFCNKMDPKKKKFFFLIFFWLFRENFDFLERVWLFLTFFYFLCLAFWVWLFGLPNM